MTRFSTFSGPRRPLRKINEKRWEKKLVLKYGGEERRQWLQRQRCSTCGARPPSDPSHIKFWSSRRGGPDDQIPQCRACHRELHNLGVPEFERRHNVNLRELADDYTERWRRYTEERRRSGS